MAVTPKTCRLVYLNPKLDLFNGLLVFVSSWIQIEDLSTIKDENITLETRSQTASRFALVDGRDAFYSLGLGFRW